MTVELANTLDPRIAADILEIGRLSALPQATMELMRLLSDDQTTPEQLQKVVEQDPALSSKVISLGNSAYYGLRTPVATIAKAIVVIGFQDLRFLAMGLGLADTFDPRKAPSGYDAEALWVHSLAVSWAARETAVLTGGADPGEAMLAGLLHNIGHIIMAAHFPSQLRNIMDFMEEGHTFREGEDRFALRHEAVGYHLARSWALPVSIRDVILNHHQPPAPAGPGQPLADAVNLSVAMTALTDFSLPYEDAQEDGAAYWALPPLISQGEKEKLLLKTKNSLPLLAPVWLRMMPFSSNGRQSHD